MKEKIKLLKALGDETRIKIVQYLLNGEQCACTIVPYIGKAQPTVSQHLKILEEAGVLEVRRQGVNLLYKIKSREAVKILDVLGIKKMDRSAINQVKCRLAKN
ncbi:MAG: metalloregulator ArsR/SmtB family transcription factor [Candidatus Altiarchaeia archaeon]